MKPGEQRERERRQRKGQQGEKEARGSEKQERRPRGEAGPLPAALLLSVYFPECESDTESH